MTDVIKGAIVYIDLPTGSADERTMYRQDIYNWLRLNAAHKFDSYFIRSATRLTSEMIWQGETEGEDMTMKWMWMFEDVNEALLFKLTFKGTQPKVGM